MGKINEEKLLAILFVNLGGKKKKMHDWIYIAKICKELVDYYGSIETLAGKIGRTSNLIRMILKLLELPKEVQGLIMEGKIMFDVGQRIAGIKNIETQRKVSKAILGLNSERARSLIKYAKKHPESLDSYRRKIVRRSSSITESNVEKINVILIPLNNDIFNKLKKISKRKNTSPEKLAANLIIECVGGN